MQPSTDRSEQNRRTSRRREAKRSVQIICYANALGLGPNVALSLLDVSEAGARVVTKVPLSPSQEIEVNLTGIGHSRAVKILAEVIWCVAAAADTYQVGLKFLRYLSYRDLQELGR